MTDRIRGACPYCGFELFRPAELHVDLHYDVAWSHGHFVCVCVCVCVCVLASVHVRVRACDVCVQGSRQVVGVVRASIPLRAARAGRQWKRTKIVHTISMGVGITPTLVVSASVNASSRRVR